MPVVQISIWPAKDESQITGLVEDVTRAVHQHTGAPLDKITVYVSEVSPTRWADGGVLGSDADFPEKSRRQAYGESE